MIKWMFVFFISPIFLFGKTLVFTTAFNRPDFIELQYKLFEKFLEDDYEFWVVSDANTLETQTAIRDICDKLGIILIQVPQEIHNLPYLPRIAGCAAKQFVDYQSPNVRHCNSVQWAWDHYISQHEGPVMLIDSDMFLIRPFSVERTLENKHLAGVLWGTQDMVTGEPYSYLWLALILFNNPSLPERETLCFNCGTLPQTQAVCDSGGWTNLYLTKFKDRLNLHQLSYEQGHQFFCPYRYAPQESQNFDHLSSDQIMQNLRSRNFTEDEIRLVLKKPYTIELLAGNHFLHYRAGTNYENYTGSFISKKDKLLAKFFKTILCAQ